MGSGRRPLSIWSLLPAGRVEAVLMAQPSWIIIIIIRECPPGTQYSAEGIPWATPPIHTASEGPQPHLQDEETQVPEVHNLVEDQRAERDKPESGLSPCLYHPAPDVSKHVAPSSADTSKVEPLPQCPGVIHQHSRVPHR